MKQKWVFIGMALSLITTTAYGQTSYVGKKTSVASTLPFFSQNVPANPATVTILSVAVPTKYNSKKDILTISTSVQEECLGDRVSSRVQVGPAFANPAAGLSAYECNDTFYETQAREWFLIPESAGGPAIPAGSIIQLILTSDNGLSLAGITVIKAQVSR